MPSSYEEGTPMPLVVALHGFTWIGDMIEEYVKQQPLTDERGFL